MPFGRERPDEVVTDVERMDLAVDVRFAQPARDQLRVLRTEIEDQYPGVGRSGHRITGCKEDGLRNGLQRRSHSTR